VLTFNALYVGDDFETTVKASQTPPAPTPFNALYVGDDFETYFYFAVF